MRQMIDTYPQDDYTDAFYCQECGLLRVERYPHKREVHSTWGAYVQFYRLYGTQSLTHMDEMDCLCGGHCHHLRLDGMKNLLRINHKTVRSVSSTSFPQEGEELAVTYRAKELTDPGMYGSVVGKWVIREVYQHIAARAIVRRKGTGVPLLYRNELHAQRALKTFPGSRTLRYCEGQWNVLSMLEKWK